MSMKSQRLWVSLGTQDLEFNRNLKLAECVKKLSFEHVQEFADQLAKRERCGEIVLYSDGKFDPMPISEKRAINGIAEFKQKIPYH